MAETENHSDPVEWATDKARIQVAAAIIARLCDVAADPLTDWSQRVPAVQQERDLLVHAVNLSGPSYSRLARQLGRTERAISQGVLRSRTRMRTTEGYRVLLGAVVARMRDAFNDTAEQFEEVAA